MAESTAKAEIKKLLNAYKPLVTWYMTVPTGFGRVGIEDFTVCAFGKFLAIEAKDKAKSKQSGPQQERQKDVIAAGGIYVVIHNQNLNLLATLLARMKQLYDEAQARKKCT